MMKYVFISLLFSIIMPIVVSLFYFNRVNKYWDRQFQMILKEIRETYSKEDEE